MKLCHKGGTRLPLIMDQYSEIVFEFLSNEQKEIVIALLSEMNFEGFEEEGDLLKAYIPSKIYDEDAMKNFSNELGISYSVSTIDERNWNELWESNFEPVVINHPAHNSPWIAVRAAFHKPAKGVDHEIIITPKMSFGTGHHATTLLMIKMMSEVDFKGKTVLDYGTGTGILAIIADKLGASKIVAVDNDPKSIANAADNFRLNRCKRIELRQASIADGTGRYNIILCNIIKMVLINNLSFFCQQLAPGSNILVSGILQSDEPEVLDEAAKNNLSLTTQIKHDNWVGIRFDHE